MQPLQVDHADDQLPGRNSYEKSFIEKKLQAITPALRSRTAFLPDVLLFTEDLRNSQTMRALKIFFGAFLLSVTSLFLGVTIAILVSGVWPMLSWIMAGGFLASVMGSIVLSRRAALKSLKPSPYINRQG